MFGQLRRSIPTTAAPDVKNTQWERKHAAKSIEEESKKQTSDATVQESIQTQGIFSGASIGVINIQNLVLPGTSGSKQASEIHATPKKRRYHIIQSSDEED